MMIEIVLDLPVTLKLDCDHYFEVVNQNTVRVSLFVIACQKLNIYSQPRLKVRIFHNISKKYHQKPSIM